MTTVMMKIPINNLNQEDHQPYDLLGIGFGPANLAVGAALAEQNWEGKIEEIIGLRVGFIEFHPEFRWHPGMMIPGSRMQISYLKDLATLRNPRSPFTFLQYLHSHGRLVSFINRATFNPTRAEFADYLSWAANQITSNPPQLQNSKNPLNAIHVFYGEQVIGVEAVKGTTGDIELLRVLSIKNIDGSPHQRLCRNLILSTGGTPRIPQVFQHLVHSRPPNPNKVIHTSNFLNQIDQALSHIFALLAHQVIPIHPIRISSLSHSPCPSHSSISNTSSGFSEDSSIPSSLNINQTDYIEVSTPSKVKIAVIGAGQSAAEALLDTYDRIKSSLTHLNNLVSSPEIDLIIRGGHLRPSDDSAFSNQVFNPETTDFFYSLSNRYMPQRQTSTSDLNPARQKCSDFLLEEAAPTNYAVVSPETISSVNEIIYAQKVERDCRSRKMGSKITRLPPLLPKINIIPHTQVVSVKDNASCDGSLSVILENVLTGERTNSHYQLIILGTGYDRQGWKQLLFGPSSENQQLGLVFNKLWPTEMAFESVHSLHSDPSRDDSPTNSIISTSAFDQHQLSSHQAIVPKGVSKLKVSRNYQLLLPKTFIDHEDAEGVAKKFQPTVWLQGCNESTHGISDSLLSVLSIRAGEFLNGIKSDGWFGMSDQKPTAA
ncbi:hypothetical protein O181_048193 [Austropuccinia psidii MF-1]|uniref:L-ornithine N(5)-monooxygenase [NAD(P)H] n=1 Tax=Austropuccinia psidii MF-1 TaxID=1389203 RepID=A0A9Q3HK90_9BASI|nr:hypothetical protein [Austropuccinia psidii MF-1]